MNSTTVKRGIGAVVLALVAAGLLAFLLKDKAAQRQEVVEIALPGATDGMETSGQSPRLPTLTTDNSGNGSVIANAGSGTGNTAGTSVAVSNNSIANNVSQNTGNGDGAVIASAAAVGAAAAAKDTISQTMDFSVKPKAATTPKATGEFLDLDLVNNSANTNNQKQTAATQAAKPAATSSSTAASTEQGVVIASTSPKTNTRVNTVQPRLIGEKNAAPVKSASTAKVIKKTVAKKATTPAASAAGQAKNGYAIQLLATSSLTRANNLKNVMAGEGYPTYVTKTQQNGKTLYRVRIGQYAAKAEAAKAQAAMKRRYKKNTNVNRSAIVAR